MMKNIYYILFMVVALGLVSCSDRSLEEDIVDGTAMSVNMKVAVPLYQTQQASSRAGAADPDGDALRNMYLLCFDENGYYLSKTQATLTATDAVSGTISGSVPSNTCRIHFVSNANMTNIDDAHYKGVSENVMIPSLYSGYGIVNYWGYKRCSTASEMRSFLESSNTVQLIRNQARVSVKSDSYKIGGLAVCNLRAFGTVALFDETKFADDPYTEAFTTDGVVSSLSDDKNIAADDPTDVSTGDTYYNIFEGTNTKSSPIVAIVKINDKYHKILLQSSDYTFLTIRRNHEYSINIAKLTEAGYDTFAEAVNGVAANNPFITIDDVVATLDYGDYSLTFPDGTSQIFNAAGTATIPFKYAHSGSTISTSDISVAWESNSGIATGAPQVVDNGDGTYGIQINLNNVTKSLQSGKISVQVKGTPIVRTINVYSIQAFEFTPLLLSQNVADATNQGVVVAFNIPEDFPADLLPLKCKISTNRFDGVDQLQVITENTDGEDWNYKYLYYAQKTGPQRVYFKTVDNGYNKGKKNTKLYLEAANFTTATGNFGFRSSSSPSQITLSSDGSSYTSDKATFANSEPVSGAQFTIHYQQPTNSTIYISTNNFVPEGATSCGEMHTGVKCYSISGSTSGSVALTSSKSSYSENIWFESDNQSASAMITTDDSYYTGGNALSIQLNSDPQYGPNVVVPLSFNFPVGGTYYIYTKYLTPQSGQGISNLSSGVYEYTASAGNKTLNFLTKNLVNTETVKVAFSDNTKANIPSASCVLKNKSISGTLTCATFRDTPFIYVEDDNGNRVGTITRSGSGTSYTYSLTLRSYYGLTTSSYISLMTNDTDNTVKKVRLTVADLLNQPNRTLE